MVSVGLLALRHSLSQKHLPSVGGVDATSLHHCGQPQYRNHHRGQKAAEGLIINYVGRNDRMMRRPLKHDGPRRAGIMIGMTIGILALSATIVGQE